MPRAARSTVPEGMMAGVPIRFTREVRHDYAPSAVVGQIGMIYSVDGFGSTLSIYTGTGTTTRDANFQHYPSVPVDAVEVIPRVLEVVPSPSDNRKDRRNLRAKLSKQLDAYKSIENPTVAVRSIIEELEGALSL